MVFITTKPVDAFLRGQWDPGFKFLPVPYDSKFEDYYLPATLEASEYPALIKQGERIATISVPTLLIRGENSDILSPELATRMMDANANIQMTTVAGSGHSVPLDQPDGFQAACREFLTGAG